MSTEDQVSPVIGFSHVQLRVGHVDRSEAWWIAVYDAVIR